MNNTYHEKREVDALLRERIHFSCLLPCMNVVHKYSLLQAV